jgi:hypothetical protein
MSDDTEKISTSALAKKLDIPVQQLFATLKDYGWIQRHKDSWLLTGKGEFEGGGYVDSRRYGRYIVWPQELQNHRLIGAIESNQRITAATMQRYYPHLHARQINRALAELGLQTHSILGWELTERGKHLGGQQQESEDSGAFYVTWPHELVDHPVIHRELNKQAVGDASVAQTPPEDDLFATGDPGPSEGLDGHQLQTTLELHVCNWLYLAQLAHAYKRALPVETALYADFYLPGARIYIECWEEPESAERLAIKLKKQDIFEQQGLAVIDIKAGELEQLDEILGRALLKFGIRV